MSAKNKRRPARPHFEKITRRHPGGAETRIPASDSFMAAYYRTYKTGSTKRAPGQ